jgi:hypothetical protein
MATTEQTFSDFREKVINQFVELKLELHPLDLALLNQPIRVDASTYRHEANKKRGELTEEARKAFGVYY